GRLWIGTSRGLSEYQRETNTFVNHHSVPGSSDELVDPNVTSLAEDSMYLWIGTENGLSRMKKSDGSFTSYGQRIGLTDLYISDVMVDRSGSVWIGTISGGLHQYNPETGQMKNFRFDGTESKQKSAERVFDTYQDREQNIWVSTSGGIVLLEPSSGSFGRFLHRSRIYEVSQDSRGFYWAAAREGLYRFTDPKEIEHFEHSPIEPRSLTATTVNCIVEDEAGLLWFGTQYGLSIYDPLKERFGPIAPSGKGLPIKDAWCMYEDRTGFVWIGSYNQGLVRFDMKKHRFDHLQSRPDQNWTLSSNLVRTVIEDAKNQIWIGMWGGGLNRVDPVTLNVSRSPIPEFSDKNILALLSDGERIWIGSDGGGLYKYDISTKNLSLPYGAGLTDAGVTCLTKDDKGILWVGTRRGLNRVDLATGRISQFSTDLTGPRNISNDYILCVTLDRAGRAWIGTDKGLNCYDPRAETMRAFYESDGLPNETVYGVIEDNHGDLWITTNRGLVRCTFKPEDNKPTFRVYDVSDGLQSNEFNQASYLRTSAGKILVGGIHGINVFHPDSIRDSDRWPPLRFTDFKILNETVDIDHHLDKSITLADQINLYPGDNIFSLEFAALDLINPARITYAYRLRGFQKNWTLVDADRRVATYTNLDPGRYLFEVKCTNRDGKWNEMPVSMIVNIIPPFWKTWWFRTC
ncbi:MAG: hypothetical protein KDC45_11480, partial [Bacteroidetes bacterium]|nr:hypothetical protein [Bacteroidota bacterium]